jgi:aspartate racemase
VLADEIAAGINIPLINMPEDAARECAERFTARGGAKIAVLATDGTARARVYQRALEKHGLLPWLPPAETQELVMSLIYDGVKNGGEISRDDISAIERAALDAGCDAALLACTEMSVIKERFALSDFYIDALMTLVKSVIRFAGKEYI